MPEIAIPTKPINAANLLAEMEAALGVGIYEGYTTRKGELYLIVNSAATADQITTAQTVVAAHNAALLTSEQQTVADLKLTAQSAVGVHVTALTNDMLRALVVVLLNNNGAIADNKTIKPLSQWRLR